MWPGRARAARWSRRGCSSVTTQSRRCPSRPRRAWRPRRVPGSLETLPLAPVSVPACNGYHFRSSGVSRKQNHQKKVATYGFRVRESSYTGWFRLPFMHRYKSGIENIALSRTCAQARPTMRHVLRRRARRHTTLYDVRSSRLQVKP